MDAIRKSIDSNSPMYQQIKREIVSKYPGDGLRQIMNCAEDYGAGRMYTCIATNEDMYYFIACRAGLIVDDSSEFYAKKEDGSASI